MPSRHEGESIAPRDQSIAQLEVNIPGYEPFTGIIGLGVGQTPDLVQIAKELHEMVDTLMFTTEMHAKT